MFSFPVMKTSLCFTDVKIIAVPATGFVNRNIVASLSLKNAWLPLIFFLDSNRPC